ncbi:hypothetical protein BCR44DRAFT_386461 [Catenaria anguillulae PL171]|uniref:Ribosomal protein L15 n=1 Tax=Catenaria anguillulae PL171 TaxID=765915 RepID=A0A1Y2HAA6_9FUNG|nr:hypothetical protein BCR44DRAFT_386461 [Catenaria anguillulae PL171]
MAANPSPLRCHALSKDTILESKSIKMGAYKYIEELYKKKQSDVLRFLARVRVWEHRHLTS